MAIILEANTFGRGVWKKMETHDIIFTVEDNRPKKVRYEYEEVLDLIGFGKTQWLVLLCAGLLLMMVINETMGINIITMASQCDFAMNSMDKAVMGAASFVGILCSSLFWGYLSDTIGRRPILVYTTFVSNFISFVSAFVPSYWIFVFLRFLVGIFIAGASSTTYAYLGEFCTTRIRPAMINYASMFVGISMMYVPAVAWLILTMDWMLVISADAFYLRPWRLLVIFNLLPGFIGALILFYLPESPKILLALRKDKEAFTATDWICLCNTEKYLRELKVYKLRNDEHNEEHPPSSKSSRNAYAALKNMLKELQPLFKRPYVFNFIISCVIMCGLFLSSSGMSLWYPEIQNRVGVGANGNSLTVCQIIEVSYMQQQQSHNETICDDTVSIKSLMDSLWNGVFFVVGFIIMGMVINLLDRKTVMIGTLCISFLCGMALHWILQPMAIVASFCLFLMLPSLCVSVLGGAVVDLLPTHMRGKALCICMMMGRSGSIIGSNIIGALLDSYCSLTFTVFSGIILVCAALTFIVPM